MKLESSRGRTRAASLAAEEKTPMFCSARAFFAVSAADLKLARSPVAPAASSRSVADRSSAAYE